MRKLIVQMQTSADGYVTAANGGLQWKVWGFGDDWPWDDTLKRDFNAIIESIDCILLSRKMLQEGYLEHWGNAATKHAANPHYDFASKIIAAKKVVLTNKLASSSWERTILARGEFAEEVRALKRQRGGNIITFGGVHFVTSLVDAGLVDEFQFFVNPTAVGQGRSIFSNQRDGAKLRLLNSTSYDCGIVLNRYSPR